MSMSREVVSVFSLLLMLIELNELFVVLSDGDSSEKKSVIGLNHFHHAPF